MNNNNNILILLLIIIIILIVIDYCKKKNEPFQTQCDKLEVGEDDDELIINNNICKLKEKRNQLLNIIEEPQQKYKNNAEYLSKIKQKINDLLEKEKEERKLSEDYKKEKIDTIKNK